MDYGDNIKKWLNNFEPVEKKAMLNRKVYRLADSFTLGFSVFLSFALYK